MAETEVKQQTRRKKRTQGAAKKVASSASEAPKTQTKETKTNGTVTKLDNGLVIVSR
jgi:hypothetical protein